MHLSFGVSFKEDGTVEIVENSLNNKCLKAREFKGNSSIFLLTDYTIIDIETTGLDPKFDEIIELSAIKIRDNQEQSIFQSLVCPEYEVDEFISELTGITNEMLCSAPTIEEILPSFLDFLGNDIVVGHNINFDVNFIYDFSLKALKKPFVNNFVDTLRLSRKLFTDLPNHKLITLAEHFNFSVLPSHRSMPDCEATLELYRLIVKYVNDNQLELTELFKRKHYSSINISEITTNKTEFDEDHPLFGQACVFTGALEKMLRKDAMQLVVDLGGHCGNLITKKINYLVLGNLDYCANVKNGESSKLKKARSLILSGNDLQIISENTFYSLVNMD